MSNRLKIFIPEDIINWNDYINKERRSFYIANNIKQKEKKMVAKYVTEKYTGNYPIGLIVRPHFQNKRKDLDNTRIKGIVDGLVANEIIKNDNLNCLQKILFEPVFDDTVGIEIEIIELQKN